MKKNDVFKPDVKILEKIKEKEILYKNVMPHFTKEEKGKIDKLIELGYVTLNWKDDNLPNDLQVLKLTNKGEVYLFIDNNQSDIEVFKEQLIEVGFNDELVETYLEYMYYHNQEISLNSDLRINSFKLWGSIQDIDIQKTKVYN